MMIRDVEVTPDDGRGWFGGLGNSQVPVAVGWADRGVDLRHRHREMCEVYPFVRGPKVDVPRQGNALPRAG
jgi:hypothetical protein